MSNDKKGNNRATIIGIAALTILIIVLMSRSGPHSASQAGTPIPPTSTASAMPKPTMPLTTPTPIPPTFAPAPTEETNWAINFEYRFPTGYWSIGYHRYTLILSCPDAQNPNVGKWTNTFNVSSSTPPVTGDLYLRPEGISGVVLFSQPITSINDAQSTIAIVSVTGLTYNQADSYVKHCTVTVQTDNSATYPLPAGVPFQP